jgi:hypothetical protein
LRHGKATARQDGASGQDVQLEILAQDPRDDAHQDPRDHLAQAGPAVLEEIGEAIVTGIQMGVGRVVRGGVAADAVRIALIVGHDLSSDV